MNTHELRARLGEIADEAKAIVDEADAKQSGQMTAKQSERFDALMVERDQIASELGMTGTYSGLEPKEALSEFSKPEPRKTKQDKPANPHATGHLGGISKPSRPAAFMHPETGAPIHAYSYNEPMAGNSADVGELVRGIAIGDLSGVDSSIRSAVTTGGDSGGSYMLQPQLATRVIDLARSASVVMRAGAQTVPMNTSELQLLRVLSDPTVTPRRETETTSASGMTFGQYTLKAKMHSAIVPVSIEQLEDAANAGPLIQQTLRNALGASLDAAILAGAGGSDVLGIVNADNTNEQTSVGTPSDWSDISGAVGSIFTANYTGAPEDLAWIHNPRDGATYDQLIGTDNQPLRPTPWAGALQRFMTTGLEVDSGNTQMIVGDCSQILVGMRTSGVVIDVLDSGQMTVDGETYDAGSQFMRFIRARIRFDALLMRPDHFTVLRGVTNT